MLNRCAVAKAISHIYDIYLWAFMILNMCIISMILPPNKHSVTLRIRPSELFKHLAKLLTQMTGVLTANAAVKLF